MEMKSYLAIDLMPICLLSFWGIEFAFKNLSDEKAF